MAGQALTQRDFPHESKQLRLNRTQWQRTNGPQKTSLSYPWGLWMWRLTRQRGFGNGITNQGSGDGAIVLDGLSGADAGLGDGGGRAWAKECGGPAETGEDKAVDPQLKPQEQHCCGHVGQTARTHAEKSDGDDLLQISRSLRHGADDPGVGQREPRMPLGHARLYDTLSCPAPDTRLPPSHTSGIRAGGEQPSSCSNSDDQPEKRRSAGAGDKAAARASRGCL